MGQDRSQDGIAPAPAGMPLKRPDRCIVHLAVLQWCVCDRESRAMPAEITVGPCPHCRRSVLSSAGSCLNA